MGSLPPLCALLAFAPLFVAAGCHDPTQPPARACPQATKEVNPLGVGRPCATAADCSGLRAHECPRQVDPAAPDFCTFFCQGHIDCGTDGVCTRVTLHDGNTIQYCAPASCAASVGTVLGPDDANPIRCEVGQVNDLGLGKVCSGMEDCVGTPMPFCPKSYHPSAWDWCTRLCEKDDECGSDGICWHTTSVEGFPIASCVSVECWKKLTGAP